MQLDPFNDGSEEELDAEAGFIDDLHDDLDEIDAGIGSLAGMDADMMLDGGMHLMGGVKKPNCLFDERGGMIPKTG